MIRLRAISLGAGVQSTTMALMAAHGEITPMPDCAIFADTQWEPKAVYDHLKWLMSGVLPFPVHVVTRGNIHDNIVRQKNTTGQRFATIPWFVDNMDGTQGIGRRQCTREYKTNVVAQKQRQLMGYDHGDRVRKNHRVEVWIGISTDEIFRAKPAHETWQDNRWPLIEARMSRWDCKQWLKRHGYAEPAKSSCIGCPYHSDEYWRDMKLNRPDEWAQAVAADHAIRKSVKYRGKQYMHRSLKPLDEVDLSSASDKGQIDMFMNECEGVCGN